MSVTYKVTQKCFIDGVLYDPEGKRKFYHVDEPFKKDKLPKYLRKLTDDERDAIKHAANQKVVKEAEQSKISLSKDSEIDRKAGIEQAEVPETNVQKDAAASMDFSGPSAPDKAGKVEL